MVISWWRKLVKRKAQPARKGTAPRLWPKRRTSRLIVENLEDRSLLTHLGPAVLSWEPLASPAGAVKFHLRWAQEYAGNPPALGALVAATMNFGDGSSAGVPLRVIDVNVPNQ